MRSGLRWVLGAGRVRGEERAHAGVHERVELGARRRPVLAQQHRAVDRRGHDQPVEVLRGGARVVDPQDAAPGQLRQRLGERRHRALGAALVERAPQVGEARRLADHEPPQLEHLRLHHRRELALREVAQVGGDVAAVAELAQLGLDGVARRVDRARPRSR